MAIEAREIGAVIVQRVRANTGARSAKVLL